MSEMSGLFSSIAESEEEEEADQPPPKPPLPSRQDSARRQQPQQPQRKRVSIADSSPLLSEESNWDDSFDGGAATVARPAGPPARQDSGTLAAWQLSARQCTETLGAVVETLLL